MNSINHTYGLYCLFRSSGFNFFDDAKFIPKIRFVHSFESEQTGAEDFVFRPLNAKTERVDFESRN